MSTAASFGRSKNGDRFYNPPAVRRQLQLQQQQQQKQKNVLERENEGRREKSDRNHLSNGQYQNQRRHKSAVAAAMGGGQRGKSAVVAETVVKERGGEFDDCASTASTNTSNTAVASLSTAASASTASSSMAVSTNLDRFLEYTTPLVPAQYFSKSSMKAWRTQGDEFRPYFVLGDLWESFREWSAYGAGVPLLLNGSDSVKQYYVPYLSGIQLYIDPSKPSPRSRRPGEESDESSRETSSGGSSDCEIDRGTNSLSTWSQQELAESTIQGMKGLSLRDKPFNGFSSDEGESSSSTGVLMFEYFEHDSPFSREPLADKISLLASRFPELRSYRSCDLSPSSWVSVAWYPIYRIPTGPTLQNLDSCFLTFHSLSTPVHGQNEWQCHNGSCPREVPNGFSMAVKLSLPIFGLASYKFKISMWDQTGVDESPKANSLLRSADEWLRLLNVNHPDYRFFASHSYYWR